MKNSNGYYYWWWSSPYLIGRSEGTSSSGVTVCRATTNNAYDNNREFLSKEGWMPDIDPYRHTKFSTYREAMSVLYQLDGKVVCINFYSKKRKPCESKLLKKI